jgi:hypothetical protein
VTFSRTDLGVNQHCMEHLFVDDLFPYKMQLSQPLSEDGIAIRYTFAREYIRSATGGQSGCLECHSVP